MLSGRFADMFSNVIFAIPCCMYHEKYCPLNEQTEKLLDYCINEVMYDTQEIFYEIIDNYPTLGKKILVSFPW